MRFCVLGPLEILSSTGEPITVPGAKPRTLLSLLLLRSSRVVSREEAIDELWGTAPPTSARHALDVYASTVRRIVGRERIVTRPRGYLFDLRNAQLDVAEFNSLLDEARRLRSAGRTERAARSLEQALALWRGSAFADSTFHGVAAADVARLAERRLATQEELLDLKLDLARHDEVVDELSPLIAAYPFRESLRAQLMVALYRAGRQADALAVYQDARRTLRDELGIEPSDRLRHLERAILSQDEALAPATTTSRGLTPPATRLVGRDRELTELRQLLWQSDVRLVTLVGPAGVGKTRLALATVSVGTSEYPGGAFFVDLSPLRDPAGVLSAIATALGETSVDAQTLTERDSTLLLLDNCEHVPAVAADIHALIARIPRLKILATSRAPLVVRGERVFPLGPLETSAAVQLFVERGRERDPSFEPSPVLEDLCRRLDCLPLAIELAAARARVLSPASLLRRLDARLPLLVDRSVDRPERHRTLRAALDWSYELLDERERDVLASLSVFAGGWTLAAAEAVCAAELDQLESLEAKSLVRRRASDGGEFRFGLLETIREYAGERLEERGDRSLVAERHATHFLRQAEDALATTGVRLGRSTFYTGLDGERDNIRAALDWFHESGDAVRELRLAAAAISVWTRAGLEEGRRRIMQALARADAPPDDVRARALAAAAHLALRSGRREEARDLAEESLALRRSVGDEQAVAASLLLVGATACEGRAAEAHDEAEAIAARLGDDELLGDVLNDRAMRALSGRRLETASALFERLLAAARRSGATQEVGIAAHNLALTRLCQRRHASATALLAESLQAFRRLEAARGIASCVEAFGLVAAGRGEAERAARLLGAAERLFEQLGASLDSRIATELHAQAVGAARAVVGDDAFVSAWVDGRALSAGQASEYALLSTHRTETRSLSFS